MTEDLRLIARPQRPVIQVASGLCLLQKASCIKNPVIALKPDVMVRLPADLGAGPVSHEPRPTTIRSPDQEPGHRVDAIFKALPPLKDPIDGYGHVMRKRRFDVRMKIDKVDRAGSCC